MSYKYTPLDNDKVSYLIIISDEFENQDDKSTMNDVDMRTHPGWYSKKIIKSH